jgi:hypothetical protein
MIELSINTWLAIFGLGLAIVELYVPNLSVQTESALDKQRLRLKPKYEKIFDSSTKFNEWMEGSAFGKFFTISIRTAFFVLVLIFLGKQLVESIFSDAIIHYYSYVFKAAFAVFFIFYFSYAVYFIFFIPAYFIIASVVSIILFFLEKLLHVMNIIGKGKALSGIGIILAFHGLITASMVP